MLAHVSVVVVVVVVVVFAVVVVFIPVIVSVRYAVGNMALLTYAVFIYIANGFLLPIVGFHTHTCTS